jgi:hypothetical protein
LANQVTKLLWIVLMSAQVLFVVAAFIIVQPSEEGVPRHVSIMAATLVFISVGTALGTVVYRRIMLVRPIREGRLDPRTPQGMTAAFPHFILSLALSESIGIYGLVLAMLSGQPMFTIPFVAAALALLFFHRPTASDLNPTASSQDRAYDSTPIG